jgi:hypothetical protein
MSLLLWQRCNARLDVNKNCRPETEQEINFQSSSSTSGQRSNTQHWFYKNPNLTDEHGSGLPKSPNIAKKSKLKS